MAGKYKIEQYPKNKDIDVSKLSEYQIEIRNNQKKYYYGKEMTCNKCYKKQPISEFYIKDKNTGRRNLYCRDCQMKQMGVVEIGKMRFADKIEDKGFRRCTVCKDIKPLTEFKKNKGQKNGISNTCYDCGHKLHHEFILKQKDEIGDFYVKQYCLKNYKYTPETKEEIEKYRNEIKEKREPKYFIDGKSFVTITDISNYIKEKYGIPKTTTEKRIIKGKTMDECKLTESQMRSKAYTKGKIKLTDTVTGKEYLFTNTCDKNLSKMIGKTSIKKGIETGKPVGGYGNSLWKNPLIVERI